MFLLGALLAGAVASEVGVLGNVADFYKDGSNNSSMDNMDRQQMMIAFDMRCVGFIMAKMVIGELMDPLIFAKFKSFLTKALALTMVSIGVAVATMTDLQFHLFGACVALAWIVCGERRGRVVQKL